MNWAARRRGAPESRPTTALQPNAEAASTAIGTGPSETALNWTFERYGIWFRSGVVGVSGLFAIFTVPQDFTLRMAVLVVLVWAWCLLRLHWLGLATRGRQRPVWQLIATDTAVLALLGLTQGWIGAATVDTWALAVVSITALSYQFEWGSRPVAALAMTVPALGPYLAGQYSVATADDRELALTLALRLLAECFMWRGFFLLTRRQARAADAVLATAANAHLEAAVAESRRTAKREHLAELHDTASATLLAVSTGAPGYDRNRISEWARRDLDALTQARDEAGPRIDLASFLTDPPEPHYRITLDFDVQKPLVVPTRPGLAMLRALQEAVENIGRHAGVEKAMIVAYETGGKFVVEAHDKGVGFDPEGIPVHKRGISSSIAERMKSVGGSASITSEGASGTSVRLVWPA